MSSTELATTNDGGTSVLALIEKISQTPNLTLEQIAVIRELVQLQNEQNAQHRKELFDESLRLCQAEMPRVEKHGIVTTSTGKRIYDYAKLEDLDACIRGLYQSHGFSVNYDAPMSSDGGKIRNIARFSAHGHTEAREISASASNRSAGNLTLTDAQKVKQTITECRRHLLEMFFNVITKGADDPLAADLITQGQADDIRTRMNDIQQTKPGILLSKLCVKYGVVRPEELKVSQLVEALTDVETTERVRASR